MQNSIPAVEKKIKAGTHLRKHLPLSPTGIPCGLQIWMNSVVYTKGLVYQCNCVKFVKIHCVTVNIGMETKNTNIYCMHVLLYM